jgi:SPP1 gp7 family putative phage head morphogenesis protein
VSVQIPSRPRARTTAAGTLEHSSAASKAGPIGPGAGPLMTEYLLPTMLPTDPGRRMKSAWKIGEAVAYVFAAERVISGKVAGMTPTDPEDTNPVGWHLEDPDGETIDDTYPNVVAREAFQVLAKPMAALSLDEAGGMRMSRRQQWELTSRHAGLCGTAFWVLDQLDGFGFPRAILYCRPDRLTPRTGSNGGLVEWRLDVGAVGNPGGVPIPREEVVPFYLQAPNEGYVATGLVEAALTKAQLNGAIDRYFTQVIAGGGRLSGIIAPRDGRIDDENTYQQLIRDWRNVTEQPEAAKRLQVVRAPVEFTKTVNTPAEMGLIDLMTRNRDDLLALWGVPYSQVGGSPAAGMGMGEARDSDRQALWENAVVPRLVMMQEPIQDLLDRLQPALGWSPRFILDLPELEPEATRYDRAKKTETVAMTNRERRALLGLAPFPDGPDGKPILGSTGLPLNDEIWVPVTVAPASLEPAPEPAPTIVMPFAPPQLPQGDTEAEQQQSEDVEDGSVRADDATTLAAKARMPAGLGKLRASIDKRVTPALQRAVQGVLDQQRSDVAKRVRKNWQRIQDHPDDEQAWWNEAKWNTAMGSTVKPALAGVGEMVGTHIEQVMANKASLGSTAKRVVDRMLMRGAARVTRINETTREGLRKLLADAIARGLSPAEAGDLVESWSGFDEYRAERIARTELMFAYNGAALESYGTLGVGQVQAIDGDDDPECAERNGQVYSVADASLIEDHPNGTLDWVPIPA